MPGPVAKLALIAAPVMALYSPTAAIEVRHEEVVADRKSPSGPSSPGMKLALIAAPSKRRIRQLCRLSSCSRRGGCPTARAPRGVQPRDEVSVNHCSRRSVVFANCGAAEDGHEEVVARQQDPAGVAQPRDQSGLIGAPVVALYSPTVPPSALATKRWLPDSKNPMGPSSPVSNWR